MANIPLKSIKFPDLDDTYTVPSNAGELPYNKNATYPDDTVGKALQNIGDSSAPAIIETAQGSIASFDDGADNIPVKDLVAEIVPLQSGSGDPSPSNVRPISGWSECNVSVAGNNLFGGIEVVDAIQQNFANVVVDTANKSFHYSPTAAEGYVQVAGIVYKGKHFPFKENTQYTFVIRVDKNSDDALNLGVAYTDGTNNGGFWKSQADAEGWIVFTTPEGKSVRNLYGGSYNTTSTEIFYNDFGIFEGVVTKADFKPYNGSTNTISFASAGTVYGGRLDVTSGVLTVTDKYLSFDGTENWENVGGSYPQAFRLYTNVLDCLQTQPARAKSRCNLFKTNIPDVAQSGIRWASSVYPDGLLYVYDETHTSDTQGFKAMLGNTNLQFVCPLITPQTYQLTPTEVKTLLKSNNVWADTGDVTVEYVADTKTFIENLVNA